MIVIRASGSADVKAVRKLARTLSAEQVDQLPSLEDETPRRKPSQPTVSPINAASLTPAAHGAILELCAREGETRATLPR
ncbi:hypothetical protein GRZ55_09660 [Chelativorans sp. ZYF759]|uniref:hypothetical protein n=1 Tax=Chelativorans sp. ZYF759 TaxID=2692213 RepID=UPI00145E653A|nr:hypothetical protein [Chelativorans sp. ZYF759]NMG39505.1 hypothetical protein [Chelativorans sp. ZYF759]